MRPVGETKKGKKGQKLSCVKLAIFPDHSRRHRPLKFCVPGRVREVVIYFKFHENRSRGLRSVEGRKSPSLIDKAHGLYNSLYYRTSRDTWHCAVLALWYCFVYCRDVAVRGRRKAVVVICSTLRFVYVSLNNLVKSNESQAVVTVYVENGADYGMRFIVTRIDTGWSKKVSHYRIRTKVLNRIKVCQWD